MPTPTEQLLSRTSYIGDGATTTWNFTFASGYIDKSHVKAYTLTPAGVLTELTLVDASFIGPYQLSITPPVAAGTTLVIYRATPKDAPLVDFIDGSNLTEAALDTLSRQAIFSAAESADTIAGEVAVVDALVTSANTFAVAAATSAGIAGEYAVAAEASALNSSSSAGAAVVAATASAGSASVALAAEIAATTIVSGLAGGFGFNGTAYDFGFVTDTATYLNIDCGGL